MNGRSQHKHALEKPSRKTKERLRDEAVGWKFKLKRFSNDKRTVAEFFLYLDSLSLCDRAYTLKIVIVWYRSYLVVSDYLVYALSGGIMNADDLTRVIPRLLKNDWLGETISPTIILLSRLDLIYPGDFERIVRSMGEDERVVLADSADYLFGNLTVEQYLKKVRCHRDYIEMICVCIRCCAVVSESKTIDLIKELLMTHKVEQLFQQTYVPMDTYTTRWILLAEQLVIRAGGKRLSDYDGMKMSGSVLHRKAFLITVADSQV